MKEELENKAKEMALRYLSFRDRSIGELRKYLKEKNIDPEKIEETLKDLAEAGLLNDSLYCANYIRYAAGKGRGPLRIEKELREKGIDPQTAKVEMEAFFEETDERAQALALAQKALLRSADPAEIGQGRMPGEKDFARVARRLASQGFRSSVIYEVLSLIKKG